MKVYRAMPDSFLTVNRNYQNLENLYYESGFTTVSNINHVYNNYYATLDEKSRKEGRYFYLFFEDAISAGKAILTNYHRFFFPYFLLAEYDIPIETIIKNIGTGKYGDNEVLECYVEKDDFNGKILNLSDLSYEDKVNYFTKSLINTTKRIQEIPEEIRDDKSIKIFMDKIGNDIVKLDCEEENVKEMILNSSSPQDQNAKVELIETNFNTNNIVTVNSEFIDMFLCSSFDNIQSYYKEKGFDCNYSEDRFFIKEDIIKSLPNKEKIQKILLSIN